MVADVKEFTPIPKDALVEIHGKLYDIRSFMDRHPGGKIALQLAQGRDSTEMFEMYHSLSDRAHKVLSKFYVRDAEPKESLYDWEKTPFYDALKKDLKAHFKATGTGWKSSPTAAAWYFVGTLMTLFSYYRFVHGDWWTIVFMPLLYWSACIPMMHHGSHFALSKHPLVNKYCAALGGILISLNSWYHQHVLGHHSHTNVHGEDPDLTHFQQLGVAFPGYRLHRDQPWAAKYTNFL
jgi:delta11-fatty-acid desaturase